jgi:hypothetical protein
MKTTYTVLEVTGSRRTSERPYTHAVIGYYDQARMVAHQRAENAANRAKNIRWETKSWNDWKRVAAVKAGDMYVNHNGYRVAASQGTIDIATGFMAKHPTLEGYLAHLDAEFNAHMEEALAKENGSMVVLRWSSSAKNAAKGMSEFDNRYSGLRVVECVPVTK